MTYTYLIFFLSEVNNEYIPSYVKTLPFINANSSDLSTIYTSVCAAIKESEGLQKSYTIITFDQPLFQKAIEMVSSNPELSTVIIRLGIPKYR